MNQDGADPFSRRNTPKARDVVLPGCQYPTLIGAEMNRMHPIRGGLHQRHRGLKGRCVDNGRVALPGNRRQFPVGAVFHPIDSPFSELLPALDLSCLRIPYLQDAVITPGENLRVIKIEQRHPRPSLGKNRLHLRQGEVAPRQRRQESFHRHMVRQVSPDQMRENRQCRARIITTKMLLSLLQLQHLHGGQSPSLGLLRALNLPERSEVSDDGDHRRDAQDKARLARQRHALLQHTQLPHRASALQQQQLASQFIGGLIPAGGIGIARAEKHLVQFSKRLRSIRCVHRERRQLRKFISIQPRGHFVKKLAEAIDIRLRPPRTFRRHEPLGAHEGMRLIHARQQSDVRELRLVIHEDDVGRLDVPMDQPALVQS